MLFLLITLRPLPQTQFSRPIKLNFTTVKNTSDDNFRTSIHLIFNKNHLPSY